MLSIFNLRKLKKMENISDMISKFNIPMKHLPLSE